MRGLFEICWPPPNTWHRATGGLNLNLSEILQLGQLWGSSTLVQVYNNLIGHTNDANVGHLVGNRNFYSNDYMVSGKHQQLEHPV